MLSYAADILGTAVASIFHAAIRALSENSSSATASLGGISGLAALCEWITLVVVAEWMSRRLVAGVYPIEAFVIAITLATVVRYILRKEFLMDIRGLRKDLRNEELTS